MSTPRDQGQGRGRLRAGSDDVETESLGSIDEDEILRMGRPVKDMTYDDRNHVSVLTQLYGSVWPRVLPFCIANMILTLIVFYFLRDHTVDPTGHKFMALILSYLVVTRAQIAYGRFMQARTYLEGCYTACRELVQHMCVLTQHDTSNGAKVWRHNVAYRTILLLRLTMATIEYESQQMSPLEIPELTANDQSELQESLSFTSASSKNDFHHNDDTLENNQIDKQRNNDDECFRAPLLLAYALRKEIMEQRSGAFLAQEFSHINEELKLLDCVTEFVKMYHGLKKLVTTPFPFPLVQMTSTFMFVFVFTLPFVLCHDDGNYPWDPLLMIFLITFGFLGTWLPQRKSLWAGLGVCCVYGLLGVWKRKSHVLTRYAYDYYYYYYV
jgi:predicted membrane chloride channel (bestrophin family)